MQTVSATSFMPRPGGRLSHWRKAALATMLSLFLLPAAAQGLFRDWLPAPPDEAGQTRPVSCAVAGMPAVIFTAQPVRFVLEPGVIRLRYTEADIERQIYMRPGRGAAIQDHSALGVSFGRWEGETLAVFTVYIDAAEEYSRDVTVLERYRPAEDPGRLEWSVTVTDPATLASPLERSGYYLDAARLRRSGHGGTTVQNCAARDVADTEELLSGE